VKIEQAEASLYSGLVKNPKELQDIQKELVSLRKHLGVLEDQQLQSMIEFEETEKTDHVAQSDLLRVQSEVIQEKAGLAGERSQLQQKRMSLETERSAALTPILPANLETYRRIREQKRGVAVTSIEDDACTACGAQVRLSEGQAARIQTSLTFCTSCGRILFAG
jgi:predicted  nucleic acid-binding Zn-ribbon protein